MQREREDSHLCSVLDATSIFFIPTDISQYTEEGYEHTVLFICRIKAQELPRRRGMAGADAPLSAGVLGVHSHSLSCSAALGFPTHDSFQEWEAKDEPEECSSLPTAGTGTDRTRSVPN